MSCELRRALLLTVWERRASLRSGRSQSPSIASIFCPGSIRSSLGEANMQGEAAILQACSAPLAHRDPLQPKRLRLRSRRLPLLLARTRSRCLHAGDGAGAQVGESGCANLAHPDDPCRAGGQQHVGHRVACCSQTLDGHQDGLSDRARRIGGHGHRAIRCKGHASDDHRSGTSCARTQPTGHGPHRHPQLRWPDTWTAQAAQRVAARSPGELVAEAQPCCRSAPNGGGRRLSWRRGASSMRGAQ